MKKNISFSTSSAARGIRARLGGNLRKNAHQYDIESGGGRGIIPDPGTAVRDRGVEASLVPGALINPEHHGRGVLDDERAGSSSEADREHPLLWKSTRDRSSAHVGGTADPRWDVSYAGDHVEVEEELCSSRGDENIAGGDSLDYRIELGVGLDGLGPELVGGCGNGEH